MRLRNVPGAREAIADSKYCINEPEKYKGSWCSDIFHNDHPLHIEIGMGKGDFIIELAGRNPDINYIGIEKFSSVLIRAVEKCEQINAGSTDLASLDPAGKLSVESDTPGGKSGELSNLCFLRFDAEHIADIFGEGEVGRIYLNFSDPWPKDRHAKRRLTSPQFLALYDRILAGDGYIQFKTDNRALFDYSVEVVEMTLLPEKEVMEMKHSPDEETVDVAETTEVADDGKTEGNPMATSTHWHIDEITYDLHHSDQLEGNVMTEYEKKFVALGHPICRYVISR